MRRRGEPRLRPDLAGIPVYRPGRAGGPAGPPVVKLSSNENPYPPLPQVRAVIAEAAGAANRYPDMFATDLVAAIAEHHRVPVGHVVTGTGSVGVAQQLLQATTGPGDEVVYAWRSFEAYPILVQISGAGPVAVPLTAETRHDLPAMADAVTERTRCVIVCTPNNPTGPAVGAAELDAFLDRVPDDVLVVLDEAYREFVREPAVADGVEVYRTRANVAVLRTFSKAYGLAGLRVGYVIAHDALADAARACAVPFGVSGIAQAAALASLGAQAQLAERVEAIVAERSRLVDGLRERGWPCPATEANFVWLPVGERTEAFAAACEAAGVAVRPFPGEGVRVTVGAAAANDVVLDVAADVLGRRSR